MNIPNELLKCKEFNSLQKLILGLILNEDPTVILWSGGYNATCGDMALELGMTRTPIRREVDVLIEMGYITCKKGMGWRKTNITDKLKELLRPNR